MTDTQEAQSLKPCPFCGEQNEIYPGYHMTRDGRPVQPAHVVDCLGCGIELTPRAGADAVAAWNRRAAPATDLCSDCPPEGYVTDKTRCLPCPRRTTPQPTQPSDWIPHNGGPMPVDGEVLVDVKHRDGDVSGHFRASYWDEDGEDWWAHTGALHTDIIAYRLSEGEPS